MTDTDEEIILPPSVDPLTKKIGIRHVTGHLTGPSRISDRLQAALDAGPKRVNIVVTAKFPPEEFHMGIYQDVGAMRGSKGKSSTLFQVKPRDVKMLARHYWIIRIDLAP